MRLLPSLRSAALAQDAGVYQFVGWMRGGSGSFLVGDSLGREWVVKMYENFQGDRLLANEVTGSVLLRAVGLPSLPWRKVLLDADLIDVLRSQDQRLASFSFAEQQFASLFVGGERYLKFPILCVPDDEARVKDLLGLYVFDVWAGHTDHREVMSVLDTQTRQVSLIAIDNGHLFFGPSSRSVGRGPVRQRMTLIMKSLVTADSSLPMLEWWIEHLRFVLPAFIDLESQNSDRTWGSNALHEAPEVFLDRLRNLERLVMEDLKHQIVLPVRRYQTNHLFG